MKLGQRRLRLGLGLVGAVYLALALLNIFRLPALNGPDEAEHLRYILILRDQRAMPLLPRYVGPGQEARAGDQAQHPPAYYAVLAVLSYACPGLPADGAVRLLKLSSVAMGLGALLCTALCARRLWPEDDLAVLAATAALAFLPLFWVMTSLLNNSAGSLLAGSACLLLLQRALAARALRARDWLGVGLSAALGMMAKITAIWLLPVIAVAVWARWRRARPPFARSLASLIGPAALPILVLVGGWLAYNTSHFGELMPERILGRQYLDDFSTIFFLPYAAYLLAYVTVINIPLTVVSPFWLLYHKVPTWLGMAVLLVYAGPALVAVLAAGWRRRREFLACPSVRAALLAACLAGGLGAWFVAVQAVLHDWNTGLYGGRYALDAAPACALIWAAGMRLLPWPRHRPLLILSGLLLLLAVSLLMQLFMVGFFAGAR